MPYCQVENTSKVIPVHAIKILPLFPHILNWMPLLKRKPSCLEWIIDVAWWGIDYIPQIRQDLHHKGLLLADRLFLANSADHRIDLTLHCEECTARSKNFVKNETFLFLCCRNLRNFRSSNKNFLTL